MKNASKHHFSCNFRRSFRCILCIVGNNYLTINLYQTKSAQSWPFALGERMLKLSCSALTHPSSISSFLFTILLLMMVRLDPGHLDVPTVSHVVQVIICYWWQPHQPAGGDNSTSQQNSKRPKCNKQYF